MPPELVEPWRTFLAELDARAEHEVQVHCCGGFVVTVVYGLAQPIVNESWNADIIMESPCRSCAFIKAICATVNCPVGVSPR